MNRTMLSFVKNNKQILVIAGLFLCLSSTHAQMLKGFKDKINSMKPASSVDGILQMTAEDIKKMQEDSASTALEEELTKIKGHSDPLNIIGIYVLKYPMKIETGNKGNFFVKKVLLDFDQEKRKIYIITGFSLNKLVDKLEINETNKDIAGRGTRTTLKLGSLFYTGGGQGYYSTYKVIAAGFKVNGMGKFVYDKQVPCKVSGLMELDKGVLYIHSGMDVDVCPKDDFDKQKVESLVKQDNLIFNYMIKKENADKIKDYDNSPKILVDKICSMAKQFNDLAAQDEGGFMLPAAPQASSADMFKPFGTDVMNKLDASLKSKGHKHFKPLYYYCFQKFPVFEEIYEDRVVGMVRTKVYIGRYAQHIVVCENLNTNPERENNFNDKAKYCYFLVNIAEYVKDKEVNRTSPVTDNSGFTGKYELLNHSMPYFLTKDENSKVEKNKK